MPCPHAPLRIKLSFVFISVIIKKKNGQDQLNEATQGSPVPGTL